MKEWLRDAFEASVRRRALRVALVVGSVLLAINHGDAILHGDLSGDRLFRMILTVLVPYIVSTVSSVGAIRDLRDEPKETAETATTRFA
ncbi:MAG TPA: nitrate/nitrite transporter NrtS [Thermoanaerobaculia bacterium]|nr:nitrate/nitrite transporter NrtS [Thermoanaerobaculia bacterium]